jgi:hypothetical protein
MWGSRETTTSTLSGRFEFYSNEGGTSAEKAGDRSKGKARHHPSSTRPMSNVCRAERLILSL